MSYKGMSKYWISVFRCFELYNSLLQHTRFGLPKEIFLYLYSPKQTTYKVSNVHDAIFYGLSAVKHKSQDYLLLLALAWGRLSTLLYDGLK